MRGRGVWIWMGLWLAGCQATLVDGVDEATANEALATLATAGLGGEKLGRGGRYAIQVPRREHAQAWRALQSAGLTEARTEQPPAPWVLSPSQAKRQARRRRATDLQALLTLRPDVTRARVTLSETGAAVVVRHPPGSPPPVTALKALVQRGAGLSSPDAVALAAHPLPLATPAPAADRGLPLALTGLAAACLAWLARRRWWRPA